MIDEQQPWLPFDFITEEKLQEEERKKKEQEEIEAAVNALPYFQNPVSDHERLFNYQYEYKHGDQQALGKMYLLSISVCKNIIKSYAQKKKDMPKLSAIDREIKATDAASYFIEQYIKRPGFMRHKSILSYLYKRVEKELWYHRKVDEIVTFVDMNDLYKEEKGYESHDSWDTEDL